jgi:DNA-binding response OmpR family regulator
MSIPQIILVIEDDSAMSAGLKDNLEIEGYRVICAGSLKEGRKSLADNVDMILLDVMLPDGNGIKFCRELRSMGISLPVIMLTAKGEEMDKVSGLESGADDYIVKPFSLRELLARIHAHLRRRQSENLSPMEQVKIGIAEVDFKRHTLFSNGKPADISARELDMLRYLVLHKGQVVSRDTLLLEVWGHSEEIVTRTVDNFILRLRKKIEPDPARPQYLLTVHGSGYKLIG